MCCCDARATAPIDRRAQALGALRCRRFRLIEELGEGGYEPVWIASEAWRSLLAATARH